MQATLQLQGMWVSSCHSFLSCASTATLVCTWGRDPWPYSCPPFATCWRTAYTSHTRTQLLGLHIRCVHVCIAVHRRKQHFGRKYKVVFLRTTFGTPLDELDNFGHWAETIKEQHYSFLPAPTPVANTLGARTEQEYYCPRADLNPAAMPEFEPMVNSVLPWIGKKLARAEEVRKPGSLPGKLQDFHWHSAAPSILRQSRQ